MLEKKERKKMLKKFVDAKANIWGSESYACTIVYEVASGKYFAECDSIMETKRLTEKNYLDVLNDMFYDYCVENASYMGVS
jgi:ferritin-like protein